MPGTINIKLPYPIKKGSTDVTSPKFLYRWDSSAYKTIRRKRRGKKGQEEEQ